MNMIEWFMEHTEMLHHLPPDKLQQLHQLVKSELARLRSGVMPQSAVDAMTAVVDDRLMADIVADSRRTNTPGFLKQESEPVKRGSGWAPFQSLEPPSGIEHVDRIASHFAELDKAQAVKHELEAQAVKRVKG
jgi:hypothetical protein